MTDFQKEEFWKALNRLYDTALENSKQLAQDTENIRALVRVAEVHERRLNGLEGE
ncbi:MAG: hypothetical protein ABSH09_24065 [Bryobacteraceae bacterium]|jgi:hypothetical protein